MALHATAKDAYHHDLIVAYEQYELHQKKKATSQETGRCQSLNNVWTCIHCFRRLQATSNVNHLQPEGCFSSPPARRHVCLECTRQLRCGHSLSPCKTMKVENQYVGVTSFHEPPTHSHGRGVASDFLKSFPTPPTTGTAARTTARTARPKRIWGSIFGGVWGLRLRP